ncbi:MAG TPA: hypothetical protein VF062_01675, partial [Candidatus Limnocylindrales bacterium]
TALRFEANNLDKTKLGPAMEKCGKYLPDGGDNVRLSPEQIEQVRKFAQCMRDNGATNWPDPEPDGTFKTGSGSGINKDDPAVAAALEKCRAGMR